MGKTKPAVKLFERQVITHFSMIKNLVNRSVTHLYYGFRLMRIFCGLFNDRCVTVYWAMPNFPFISYERIYGVVFFVFVVFFYVFFFQMNGPVIDTDIDLGNLSYVMVFLWYLFGVKELWCIYYG